jgi:hypothetical protein
MTDNPDPGGGGHQATAVSTCAATSSVASAAATLETSASPNLVAALSAAMDFAASGPWNKSENFFLRCFRGGLGRPHHLQLPHEPRGDLAA